MKKFFGNSEYVATLKITVDQALNLNNNNIDSDYDLRLFDNDDENSVENEHKYNPLSLKTNWLLTQQIPEDVILNAKNHEFGSLLLRKRQYIDTDWVKPYIDSTSEKFQKQIKFFKCVNRAVVSRINTNLSTIKQYHTCDTRGSTIEVTNSLSKILDITVQSLLKHSKPKINLFTIETVAALYIDAVTVSVCNFPDDNVEDEKSIESVNHCNLTPNIPTTIVEPIRCCLQLGMKHPTSSIYSTESNIITDDNYKLMLASSYAYLLVGIYSNSADDILQAFSKLLNISVIVADWRRSRQLKIQSDFQNGDEITKTSPVAAVALLSMTASPIASNSHPSTSSSSSLAKKQITSKSYHKSQPESITSIHAHTQSNTNIHAYDNAQSVPITQILKQQHFKKIANSKIAYASKSSPSHLPPTAASKRSISPSPSTSSSTPWTHRHEDLLSPSHTHNSSSLTRSHTLSGSSSLNLKQANDGRKSYLDESKTSAIPKHVKGQIMVRSNFPVSNFKFVEKDIAPTSTSNNFNQQTEITSNQLNKSLNLNKLASSISVRTDMHIPHKSGVMPESSYNIPPHFAPSFTQQDQKLKEFQHAYNNYIRVPKAVMSLLNDSLFRWKQSILDKLYARDLARHTRCSSSRDRKRFDGSRHNTRTVWSCGQNSYGELGHGDMNVKKMFQRIDIFHDCSVTSIGAGNEHSVFVTDTGKVYVAGYNDNGQCGLGTLQQARHITVMNTIENEDVQSVYVSNGCEHTLMVTHDGKALSCGYNYRGQLGHGSTGSESTPRIIRSLNSKFVIKASCSYHHSVILCSDGSLYSFGRNDHGQLGHGDIFDKKAPHLIVNAPRDINCISCGQFHTVVSTECGHLYACGKNDFGQLGLEGVDGVTTLTKVKLCRSVDENESIVIQVCCGYYHTLLLLQDGTVLSSGRNDYGQLGFGSSHTQPKVLSFHSVSGLQGKGVTFLASGCYHSLVACSNGMLYVFGRNNHGQLGTGDCDEKRSPYPIDLFLGRQIIQIAAGFYHTLVLTSESFFESFKSARNINREYSPSLIRDILNRSESIEDAVLTIKAPPSTANKQQLNSHSKESQRRDQFTNYQALPSPFTDATRSRASSMVSETNSWMRFRIESSASECSDSKQANCKRLQLLSGNPSVFSIKDVLSALLQQISVIVSSTSSTDPQLSAPTSAAKHRPQLFSAISQLVYLCRQRINGYFTTDDIKIFPLSRDDCITLLSTVVHTVDSHLTNAPIEVKQDNDNFKSSNCKSNNSQNNILNIFEEFLVDYRNKLTLVEIVLNISSLSTSCLDSDENNASNTKNPYDVRFYLELHQLRKELLYTYFVLNANSKKLTANDLRPSTTGNLNSNCNGTPTEALTGSYQSPRGSPRSHRRSQNFFNKLEIIILKLRSLLSCHFSSLFPTPAEKIELFQLLARKNQPVPCDSLSISYKPDSSSIVESSLDMASQTVSDSSLDGTDKNSHSLFSCTRSHLLFTSICTRFNDPKNVFSMLTSVWNIDLGLTIFSEIITTLDKMKSTRTNEFDPEMTNYDRYQAVAILELSCLNFIKCGIPALLHKIELMEDEDRPFARKSEEVSYIIAHVKNVFQVFFHSSENQILQLSLQSNDTSSESSNTKSNNLIISSLLLQLISLQSIHEAVVQDLIALVVSFMRQLRLKIYMGTNAHNSSIEFNNLEKDPGSILTANQSQTGMDLSLDTPLFHELNCATNEINLKFNVTDVNLMDSAAMITEPAAHSSPWWWSVMKLSSTLLSKLKIIRIKSTFSSLLDMPAMRSCQLWSFVVMSDKFEAVSLGLTLDVTGCTTANIHSKISTKTATESASDYSELRSNYSICDPTYKMLHRSFSTTPQVKHSIESIENVITETVIKITAGSELLSKYGATSLNSQLKFSRNGILFTQWKFVADFIKLLSSKRTSLLQNTTNVNLEASSIWSTSLALIEQIVAKTSQMLVECIPCTSNYRLSLFNSPQSCSGAVQASFPVIQSFCTWKLKFRRALTLIISAIRWKRCAKLKISTLGKLIISAFQHVLEFVTEDFTTVCAFKCEHNFKKYFENLQAQQKNLSQAVDGFAEYSNLINRCEYPTIKSDLFHDLALLIREHTVLCVTEFSSKTFSPPLLVYNSNSLMLFEKVFATIIHSTYRTIQDIIQKHGSSSAFPSVTVGEISLICSAFKLIYMLTVEGTLLESANILTPIFHHLFFCSTEPNRCKELFTLLWQAFVLLDEKSIALSPSVTGNSSEQAAKGNILVKSNVAERHKLCHQSSAAIISFIQGISCKISSLLLAAKQTENIYFNLYESLRYQFLTLHSIIISYIHKSRMEAYSQSINEIYLNPSISSDSAAISNNRQNRDTCTSRDRDSSRKRCQDIITKPLQLHRAQEGYILSSEQLLNSHKSTDFTLTFWLYNSDARGGFITGKVNHNEAWPLLLLTSEGKLSIVFGCGNEFDTITSILSIPISAWVYLSVVVEQKKIKLFVNGILDAFSVTKVNSRSILYPIVVGTCPSNFRTRIDTVKDGFEGLLALYKYYTRALSPIHIRALFESGPPESHDARESYLYQLLASCQILLPSKYQISHFLQDPIQKIANILQLIFTEEQTAGNQLRLSSLSLLGEILHLYPSTVVKLYNNSITTSSESNSVLSFGNVKSQFPISSSPQESVNMPTPRQHSSIARIPSKQSSKSQLCNDSDDLLSNSGLLPVNAPFLGEFSNSQARYIFYFIRLLGVCWTPQLATVTEEEVRSKGNFAAFLSSLQHHQAKLFLSSNCCNSSRTGRSDADCQWLNEFYQYVPGFLSFKDSFKIGFKAGSNMCEPINKLTNDLMQSRTDQIKELSIHIVLFIRKLSENPIWNEVLTEVAFHTISKLFNVERSVESAISTSNQVNNGSWSISALIDSFGTLTLLGEVSSTITTGVLALNYISRVPGRIVAIARNSGNGNTARLATVLCEDNCSKKIQLSSVLLSDLRPLPLQLPLQLVSTNSFTANKLLAAIVDLTDQLFPHMELASNDILSVLKSDQTFQRLSLLRIYRPVECVLFTNCFNYITTILTSSSNALVKHPSLINIFTKLAVRTLPMNWNYDEADLPNDETVANLWQQGARCIIASTGRIVESNFPPVECEKGLSDFLALNCSIAVENIQQLNYEILLQKGFFPEVILATSSLNKIATENSSIVLPMNDWLNAAAEGTFYHSFTTMEFESISTLRLVYLIRKQVIEGSKRVLSQLSNPEFSCLEFITKNASIAELVLLFRALSTKYDDYVFSSNDGWKVGFPGDTDIPNWSMLFSVDQSSTILLQPSIILHHLFQFLVNCEEYENITDTIVTALRVCALTFINTDYKLQSIPADSNIYETTFLLLEFFNAASIWLVMHENSSYENTVCYHYVRLLLPLVPLIDDSRIEHMVIELCLHALNRVLKILRSGHNINSSIFEIARSNYHTIVHTRVQQKVTYQVNCGSKLHFNTIQILLTIGAIQRFPAILHSSLNDQIALHEVRGEDDSLYPFIRGNRDFDSILTPQPLIVAIKLTTIDIDLTPCTAIWNFFTHSNSVISSQTNLVEELNLKTNLIVEVALGVLVDFEPCIFETVFRGNSARFIQTGLQPQSNYQIRCRVVIVYSNFCSNVNRADNTLKLNWSDPISFTTESQNGLRFDSLKSGPDIIVSDDGYRATYIGDDNWSTILCNQCFTAGIISWKIRLISSPSAYLFVGIAGNPVDLTTFLGGCPHGWGLIGEQALYHNREKLRLYGDQILIGDVIGVTLDLNVGTLSYSRNGRNLGVAFDQLYGELYPAISFYNSGQEIELIPDGFQSTCTHDAVPFMDSRRNLEELNLLQEILNNLNSNQPLSNDVLELVMLSCNEWNCDTQIRCQTASGNHIWLSTDDKQLLEFKLIVGQRVRTPQGIAKVVGFGYNRVWFHINETSSVWFFTKTQIFKFREKGYFVPCTYEYLSFGIGEESTYLSQSEDTPFSYDINYLRETLEPTRWSKDMDVNLVAFLTKKSESPQEHVTRHDESWVNTPVVVPWDVPCESVTQDFRELQQALSRCVIKNNTLSHKWGVSGPKRKAVIARLGLIRLFNHLVDSYLLSFVSTSPIFNISHSWTSCEDSAIKSLTTEINSELLSKSAINAHTKMKRIFHFGSPSSSSHGSLSASRHLFFSHIKVNHFWTVVAESATHSIKTEDDYDYPEELLQITINRLKSIRAREAVELLGVSSDDLLQSSMFYQLWKELRNEPTSKLRLSYTHPLDDNQPRMFKIKFEGEGSDDYGGPYREIFQLISDELQSMNRLHLSSPTSNAYNKPDLKCHLPLLIPTANWNDDSSGSESSERYSFTFQSAWISDLLADLYRFLGQFLGIAIRSKITVNIPLATFIWKSIVDEPLGAKDIYSFDYSSASYVTHLVNLYEKYIDSSNDFPTKEEIKLEIMATIEDQTWVVNVMGGHKIELIPSGMSLLVEFDDLEKYIKLYTAARLEESKPAIDAVKEGFFSVIPSHAVALLSGDDLCEIVCGTKIIDIRRLKDNTEYDEDVSPTDQHVQFFWSALSEFSEDEKVAFLRFAWARSSLPPKNIEFSQKFKIQNYIIDDSSTTNSQAPPTVMTQDKYLPKAHTCFFSINLPKYSTKAVLTEKLKYAILNCTEMDADYRLTNVDVIGWDGA